MRKKFFAPLLVILVIVYVAILRFQGFDLSVFSKVDPYYVLFAVLISFLTLTLRSFKYFLLLRTIGVNLDKSILMITNYGFFSNFISPVRISEIVRSYLIKIKTKQSFFKILPPTIFDSLADGAVLIFIIIILSFFVGFSFDYASRVVFLIIIIATAVISFYIMTSRRGEKLVLFLLPKLFKRFVGKEIKNKSKLFIRISKLMLSKKKTLLAVFVLTFLSWGVEGIRFYLIARAAGIPIDFFLATILITTAYLLGGSFINPSGIVQEAVLLILLLQLPYDKLSLTLAGSLDAVISIGFVLILGLLYTLKLGTGRFKINEAKN